MQTSGTSALTSSALAADSSPPSRTSHTLPPITSLSAQQGGEEHEHTPAITRRPTFPFSRQQLHKSETSAFTPVGQNALSEDDLASTATLTASVMSIPGSSSFGGAGGGGGGNYPHTSTNLQTTPTLTSTTPTDSSMTSSHVTSFQSGSNYTQESTLTRMNANSVPEANSSMVMSASSSLDQARSRAHVSQAPSSGVGERKGVINGINYDDSRIMIGSMPGDGYDVSLPSGIAGSISWLQSQVGG